MFLKRIVRAFSRIFGLNLSIFSLTLLRGVFPILHTGVYTDQIFFNSRSRVHISLIFRLHETGAKLSCRSSISLSGGSWLAFPEGPWRWKRWQSDILTCMHGLHAWKSKEKNKTGGKSRKVANITSETIIRKLVHTPYDNWFSATCT